MVFFEGNWRFYVLLCWPSQPEAASQVSFTMQSITWRFSAVVFSIAIL